MSLNEISQLLSVQVHRITSLHQINANTLFACPIQANPEPLEVSWSFVTLDELAREPDVLVGKSNLASTHRQVVSRAAGMSLGEIMSISGRGSTVSSGLLVCRARNKLGWQQQETCINLLLQLSGKPLLLLSRRLIQPT